MPEVISGQKQGLAGLYGLIQAEAAMLSFNDIYRTLAFMMMLLVPSFLILRRLRRAEPATESPAH
jgi:hypothetical protein